MLLPAQVIAEEPVHFAWAVLADMPAETRTLDFTVPLSLPEGTTLQIYIEQQSGSYIYLYLLSSSGQLYFLFPEQTDYYSAHPPMEKKFWIPAKSDHFELVPPGGQEKLYLMASGHRLENLEKLTEKYMENRDDPEKKAAVLQELKKIRRQYSTLAQTTETSVPVAGTVRTRGDQDYSFEAIKVNATDFYSKVLRINHD